MTSHEKLALIYRKGLRTSPLTYARKLHALEGLTYEDLDVICKTLGFYKSRDLLAGLGFDVDFSSVDHGNQADV